MERPDIPGNDLRVHPTGKPALQDADWSRKSNHQVRCHPARIPPVCHRALTTMSQSLDGAPSRLCDKYSVNTWKHHHPSIHCGRNDDTYRLFIHNLSLFTTPTSITIGVKQFTFSPYHLLPPTHQISPTAAFAMLHATRQEVLKLLNSHVTKEISKDIYLLKKYISS